ncbi:DCL family protein [Streptomyces cacaoi]
MDGDVTGPDDDAFLRHLLECHPEYDLKRGDGIAHFRVIAHTDHGRRSVGLALVRLDGEVADFSWNACLTPLKPAHSGTCRVAARDSRSGGGFTDRGTRLRAAARLLRHRGAYPVRCRAAYRPCAPDVPRPRRGVHRCQRWGGRFPDPARYRCRGQLHRTGGQGARGALAEPPSGACRAAAGTEAGQPFRSAAGRNGRHSCSVNGRVRSGRNRVEAGAVCAWCSPCAATHHRQVAARRMAV